MLTESVFGQSGTQYIELTQKSTVHGFWIGSWVKTLFQDQDLRIQDQGLNLEAPRDQDQDPRTTTLIKPIDKAKPSCKKLVKVKASIPIYYMCNVEIMKLKSGNIETLNQ